MKSNKKIFLISLGCAKNLVDSENMLGLLLENGFSVVSGIDEADVAIVNTCGFIQSAVEESIDTIFEVASRKSNGRLERLLVVGCFVQRYGYKLMKEIPEVDGWLGTGKYQQVVDLLKQEPQPSSSFLINRPTGLEDHTSHRFQTTPPHSAYLKIAEGCSHKCSYCVIPALRGPYRSRNPESLVIEAKKMVDRGVKEINLIAQDTAIYGSDLGKDIHLEDLLERLTQIRGISWIRILYSHPHQISNRLLQLMEEEEAICPYLDIPLQHIHEKILKAMGRPSNQESPWKLLDRIRSGTRELSLRTTLMVGFPGETGEIFRELYQFVEAVAFDHLGAFIYSREQGTPAARFKNGVEPGVAKGRLDAIMKLQAGILKEKNHRLVGQVVPVLVEGESEETELLLTGRTANMAPDVDGRVLITKGKGIVGEITPVRITDAYSYDLIGEIIE